MKMHVSAFRSSEEGNAFIELALILPTLLLMLLGVLDFGLVLMQYMAVCDSVRAAAEYATVHGHEADTATIQTLARQFGSNIPGYSASAVQVCACTPSGNAVSCTTGTGTCSGAPSTPFQYVQVTATATLPLIFKVQGFPISIPVKSSMKVRTAYSKGL